MQQMLHIAHHFPSPESPGFGLAEVQGWPPVAALQAPKCKGPSCAG